MRVRSTEHWGCPLVSWGVHRQGVPSSSLADLLTGSARVVTRTLVPLMHSKGPGTLPLAGHWPPGVPAPEFPGRNEKEVGL